MKSGKKIHRKVRKKIMKQEVQIKYKTTYYIWYGMQHFNSQTCSIFEGIDIYIARAQDQIPIETLSNQILNLDNRLGRLGIVS